MKRTTILMAAFLCLFSLTESPAQNTHKNMEQLNLTQEWDKTYPKSDKVNHSKVTFINRYGITLAADLYAPKTIFGGKLPAIAVSGPFGAVKDNTLYRILISNTPSSNNDTHHYQSDNHQCCSDKIQRIHIYRFGKLIQPSLSCKVRYYNSHQDRWDSNI